MFKIIGPPFNHVEEEDNKTINYTQKRIISSRTKTFKLEFLGANFIEECNYFGFD